MPYRKKRFERPRIQPRHGRKAVVYWGGDEIYLGPWDGQGTPPPQVLEKYLSVCADLEREFEAQRLGVRLPTPPEKEGELILVEDAVARYLQFLEADEDGYKKADGTLSDHFRQTVKGLEPLVRLFGHELLSSLTPESIRTYRWAVQDHIRWLGRPLDVDVRPWTRPGINRHLGRIRRWLDWCHRQGYVDADFVARLKQVPGLRKGYCNAPEPKLA